MEKKPVILLSLTILILLILLLLFGIYSYNGIIAKNEAADSAWAQVESTCQRRSDLISNIVNTVSVHLSYKKTTLTEVAAERLDRQQKLKMLLKELQQAQSAAKNTSEQIKKNVPEEKTLQSFAEGQAKIEIITEKLLAVIEAYPNPGASDQMIALQAQLRGTKNRINRARITFNQKAKAFNSSIRAYPGRLFAILFDFQSKPYFQREAQEESTNQL